MDLKALFLKKMFSKFLANKNADMPATPQNIGRV